jgi:dTDP-4-dehydrorhamnose reductase
MQKVFVFGSTGMLGSCVTTYLAGLGKYTVIPFARKDVDVATCSHVQLTELLVDRHELGVNDVIVNCAGAIPQTETSRTTFFAVNTIFPTTLAALASVAGAHFIHVTTDCVFDGKTGSYNEDSVHTETNDYGRSKSLGERIHATVVRTSIVGEERKAHQSLLDWTRRQTGSVNGFTNHLWNGVTCLSLAQIFGQIIADNGYWVGVRHVFSPDTVSKHALLSLIKDVYHLKDLTIVPFATPHAVDKTLATCYHQCSSFHVPLLLDQLRDAESFYRTHGY